MTIVLTLPAVPAMCEERPLPAGKLGEVISLGREISLNTAAHPMSKQYSGNALNCSSCHLKNGTDMTALPYVGVAATYPAYAPCKDTVVTLSDRTRCCFMRSINAMEPPADSPMITAVVAYITWLSEGIAIEMDQSASGAHSMKRLNVNPDAIDLGNGKKVFVAQCASCHGENGQGVKTIQFPDASPGGCPPLWGSNSYNKGAGMYKLDVAASFIKAAMPYAAPNLSEKDSADVAAYINSKDRPDFDLKKHLPNSTPHAKVAE